MVTQTEPDDDNNPGALPELVVGGVRIDLDRTAGPFDRLIILFSTRDGWPPCPHSIKIERDYLD